MSDGDRTALLVAISIATHIPFQHLADLPASVIATYLDQLQKKE